MECTQHSISQNFLYVIEKKLTRCFATMSPKEQENAARGLRDMKFDKEAFNDDLNNMLREQNKNSMIEQGVYRHERRDRRSTR